MAKKHEALYRRFKADESAQTITGPYRQLHPHDNNERQAVHEHGSALGDDPGYASAAGRRVARGRAMSPRRVARAPPGARRPARPRPARRPDPVRRGDPVRGRHRPRRHRLPPQLGRLRQEVPAGDHGLGPRPLRLRQRRVARRLLRERNGLAGPAGAADLLRALPQRPRRHLHRRHEGGRPRGRRCSRSASPPPTTTTTAGRTSTSPRSAATTSSATWATGRSPTSPRRRARRGRGPSAPARCSSTTTRTGTSTSWWPTT